MNSLLDCDTYVIGDVLRFLPYNHVTLVRSTCSRFNNAVDIFLQQQTKVCGCWQCVQDFIDENPNIHVKEINLYKGDDMDCCGEYSFHFPDTIEKMYVEDGTDAHVIMPLPKQLKVFHTGGIWDDGNINCPELEEFLCCNTGASPPPYEFEPGTTTKIKTFIMDRCGDNGENPMEFMEDSPLETLMLSTATDETLMNKTKLRYLECGKLDGSCFKNLQNLEYLIFSPKKTFDSTQFVHLTKLKTLEINKYVKQHISYNIFEQLQYVSATLENLSINSTLVRNMEDAELIKLAEFITTKFTHLKGFYMYDYENKLIKFMEQIIELSPTIHVDRFMPNFLYKTIVKPNGFYNVCIHDSIFE